MAIRYIPRTLPGCACITHRLMGATYQPVLLVEGVVAWRYFYRFRDQDRAFAVAERAVRYGRLALWVRA